MTHAALPDFSAGYPSRVSLDSLSDAAFMDFPEIEHSSPWSTSGSPCPQSMKLAGATTPKEIPTTPREHGETIAKSLPLEGLQADPPPLESLQAELRRQISTLQACVDKFVKDRDIVARDILSQQHVLIQICVERLGCPSPSATREVEYSGKTTEGTGAMTTKRSTNSDCFFPPSLPPSPDHGTAPPRRSMRARRLDNTASATRLESKASVPLPLVRSLLKQRSTPLGLFRPDHFILRREYELILGPITLLNSLYVGAEVQQAGENFNTDFDSLRIGAIVFITIFCFDLVSRGYVLGCRFFRRKRNLFDAIVMFIMVVEELLRLADYFHSTFVLQAFRVARLVRVLHVCRYFMLFRQFRLLVYTVRTTLAAMFWVLVFCGLYIYMFSVAMAEGALEYCHVNNTSDSSCQTFGRLTDTILILFKAMFGGILWGDLYDRTSRLGTFFSIVLTVFLILSLTIVMNVITGVVLEWHHEIYQTETETVIDTFIHRRNEYVNMMLDIFEKLDLNCSGSVSKAELTYAAQDQRMMALLDRLGLNSNDLDGLFSLLDRDDSGLVDIEEFVAGGLRMRGEAKATDVLKLQMDVQAIRKCVVKWYDNQPHVMRVGVTNSLANMEEGKLSMPLPILSQSAHVVRGFGHHQSSLTDMAAGSWQVIDNVVNRGMTMTNLKAVRSLVFSRCISEKWTNPQKGSVLKPNEVNLYHFNHYYISPCTAPQGVHLSGLSVSGLFPGQKIIQVSRMTGSSMVLAEGLLTNDPLGGELLVQLLRGRFHAASEAGFSDCCVMSNGVDLGAPTAVTVPVSLSYKELMHPVQSKPRWFCSHWWGETISDFVACCEKHSVARASQELEGAYWICAYANRQHELASDISDDPDNSSFRRAMRVTLGTLLILDDKATPFHRIWCDFELYKTFSENKLLDIATINMSGGGREPQLLSQGCLPGESMSSKMRREQKFPIKLLVAGLKVRLEDGDASVQSDKEQILRCMGKDKVIGQAHDEETLASALQRANSTLHSYLAQAAWPQALKKQCVEDFDPDSPGSMCLPQILSQDMERRTLHLSFASVLELRDDEMKSIAKGLPSNLTYLQLSFEGCSNITDKSMYHLAKHMPEDLHVLILDFVGCQNITDEGVASLAAKLPSSLRELRLDFALCNHVAMLGIKVLGDNLPVSLVRFTATFQGTQIDRKFESVQELQKFVKSNTPHVAPSTSRFDFRKKNSQL